MRLERPRVAIAAARKAVAADPKAIGYIEKSQVDDTVKVILTVQ